MELWVYLEALGEHTLEDCWLLLACAHFGADRLVMRVALSDDLVFTSLGGWLFFINNAWKFEKSNSSKSAYEKSLYPLSWIRYKLYFPKSLTSSMSVA